MCAKRKNSFREELMGQPGVQMQRDSVNVVFLAVNIINVPYLYRVYSNLCESDGHLNAGR